MSRPSDRARELARLRQRKYRRRLGPRSGDHHRVVLQIEVSAALIDEAVAVLHRIEAGRWPRLRRPPDAVLSLSEIRAQRTAVAGEVLRRRLDEIVMRHAVRPANHCRPSAATGLGPGNSGG
jgi:hypothetical protein